MAQETTAKVERVELRTDSIILEGLDPGMMHARMAPEQIDVVERKLKTKFSVEQLLEFSLHRLRPLRNDCEYGFPAQALRLCMGNAFRTTQFKGKAEVFGIVTPLPDGPDGLIAMEVPDKEYDTPLGPQLWAVCDRKTINRNAKNAPVRAVNPVFPKWRAKVEFRYQVGKITPTELVNLLEQVGSSVGIGGWRIEKGGMYGGFRVLGDAPKE